VKAVGVVGYKKSGKTTLIIRLLCFRHFLKGVGDNTKGKKANRGYPDIC
jgi:ribosome biogenesis GTPase A